MSYKLEKPYTDKQKADFVCANQGLNRYEDENCVIMYANTEKIENGVVIDISQTPEYLAEELEKAKSLKIKENETKRNEYLLSGVEYQSILFDSDLEQKINIMATVNSMSNSDVITWYGMDNQTLDCTKQDLINIGGLLTTLTSRVWAELNPFYINAINNAQTIEELNSIEINY